MYRIHSQELLAKQTPKVPFPSDLRLGDHIRPAQDGDGKVYEFIGTDSFGPEWYTRRRFEIDAGRLEVPILYTPIYETISDANLPRNVSVQTLTQGGMVLEEIFEGGEVKFGTISTGQRSVTLAHYGVGLEYSDDLVAYNEFWGVPLVEREVGRCYNALLNHLHLSPILTATYAAGNQTAAVTSGATFAEDMFLTIEAGIQASRTDTTNPRGGPYVLLVSSANLFSLERSLTRTPQQGFSLQSSALGMISDIIAYDGWTGIRGKKTVTYAGVAANTAYLVSLQYKGADFISFMKQGLEEYGRQEDVSRFLLQVVWDARLGLYANPLAAVEQITLPTA